MKRSYLEGAAILIFGAVGAISLFLYHEASKPIPNHDTVTWDLRTGEKIETLARQIERMRAIARDDAPKDPQWESWCEPLTYPRCERAGDNEPCPPGPDGRPMACVVPWWDDGRQPVCAPTFPTRAQQHAEKKRLRALVGRVCEPPHWWDRGMGLNPYCWRHKRGKTCAARCNPDALTAFLSAIALRESTWRPWERHRLNPDVEGAVAAWQRRGDVFSGNPHYPDKRRWSHGIGLYGMNPALFLDAWDPQAPPEVLCKTEVATLTALRRMRDVWWKYRSGIQCGDSTYHGSAAERAEDWSRALPSWTDLHRAVWGGRFCPGRAGDDLFRRRAKREGLDPDAPVSLEMLGRRTDREHFASAATG